MTSNFPDGTPRPQHVQTRLDRIVEEIERLDSGAVIDLCNAIDTLIGDGYADALCAVLNETEDRHANS